MGMEEPFTPFTTPESPSALANAPVETVTSSKVNHEPKKEAESPLDSLHGLEHKLIKVENDMSSTMTALR